MPWFFIKGVENGGILNYKIRNNLVEIQDSEHLALLRKEPARFQELTRKEVAAYKKRAATTSVSEADEEPTETDEVAEDSEEDKGSEDEASEDIADEDVEDVEPEPEPEEPKKKVKKVKKKTKK